MSSSTSSKFKYDVFITLRDPNSCVKAYVENTLRDSRLIRAFVEDEEERFSVLEPTLVSRIVIVLITPEFLESAKCLERLKLGISWWPNSLLPAYCGVSREKVHEKMGALFPTFDFAGVASLPAGFKLSGDFWNRINSHMATLGLFMLHDESLRDIPPHQVGLPLRVRKLPKILGWRYILLNHTIIVRIWGDGGTGKTTIAKAIHDRIGANFEGKSFLSNIKDSWKEDNGEVLLKKQLISDINSEAKFDDETNNVIAMHEQTKQVLCGRRVLIVLDNVNSESQLDELIKDVKWCGKGSLILITTRHKAIFDAFVDISYEMKRLNSVESLVRFHLYAFKNFGPTKHLRLFFFDRIIEFCEALPLALEVFGSFLQDRPKEKWEKIINNIPGIPYDSVQEKLKLRCDLLTDIEKDLFFNIAWFYVGHNKSYDTQFLKNSRLPVEKGMLLIIEGNLVKIINEKLYVHDLLQDIGREISSSKPKLRYSYDVFLRFRGDDTHKSFTSHLCAALKQASLEVYMDEERIERGKIFHLHYWKQLKVREFQSLFSLRIMLALVGTYKNYRKSRSVPKQLIKRFYLYFLICGLLKFKNNKMLLEKHGENSLGELQVAK